MEWNKEDRDALIAFKNSVECDDILLKEKIKRTLLNNRFLIHVLGNVELEESEAEIDEYFYNNIYPYYLIPDVQSSTKCFVCYETHYSTVNKYNNTQKLQQIVFTVLCHKDVIVEPCTGICRHDLLAALILRDFNWVPAFGHAVSVKGGMTDSNYLTKTIVFEQWTDNNIVKTKATASGKTPVIINKIDVFGKE